MSEQISAAQALQILRRQRHSFLNHLQVISGWLQLGKPERASQYLDTVATRMTGESETLRQSSALLGLLVLDLGLEAETHSVELTWRFRSAPAAIDAAALRVAVMNALATVGNGGRVVIELTADGFLVHTPSGKGEG